ncbi:hypothetical protein CY0110_04997 [Crocosphaera chwakensis CCY0110]|uniref:Uncharacterized protein n=2 Tax=Crocosphaera TaxID=263510 RepID=A3IYP4_9CHRO|nr:hypothetical protein CY0110_04997 [Crocosphaera chwakensis CCY0110]
MLKWIVVVYEKMKEKSIRRITLEQAKSLEDLTDWERIEKMSESEIEQNALEDADNQPITAVCDFIQYKKLRCETVGSV